MLQFVLTHKKSDMSIQPLTLQMTPSPIRFHIVIKYLQSLTLGFLRVSISPVGSERVADTPCSLNFLHISLWMQALEAERPFTPACSVIRRYIVSSLSSTTWQWQELLTQATPDPLVPLGCNLQFFYIYNCHVVNLLQESYEDILPLIYFLIVW